MVGVAKLAGSAYVEPEGRVGQAFALTYVRRQLT